jgi:hypothetical protein
MNDDYPYREFTLTDAQAETLARIRASFRVERFELRRFDGKFEEHQRLICVSARVYGEGGTSSAAAEWIIRADGEVISRAAAAASPGEWIIDGQERI